MDGNEAGRAAAISVLSFHQVQQLASSERKGGESLEPVGYSAKFRATFRVASVFVVAYGGCEPLVAHGGLWVTGDDHGKQVRLPRRHTCAVRARGSTGFRLTVKPYPHAGSTIGRVTFTGGGRVFHLISPQQKMGATLTSHLR